MAEHRLPGGRSKNGFQRNGYPRARQSFVSSEFVFSSNQSFSLIIFVNLLMFVDSLNLNFFIRGYLLVPAIACMLYNFFLVD